MEQKNEMKRTLGFFPALTTVMGTVIGAGVFFKAGRVAELTGQPGLHLLVWVLGGIISICGGLTAAELAAAIPETGGMIRYIQRGFGKRWAFLLGWAQSIIYFPANIAALSVVFGTQFLNLFGMNVSASSTAIIGAIAAVSVTLINFISSKAGGGLQSVTTVIKLIPIALIVVVGLLRPGGVEFQLLPIAAGENLSLASAIGSGLLATMFAYDGWIYAGNIAGEMKNPAKHLPRAIILGIVAIMFVYIFVNAAYIRTLGIPTLMQNDPNLPAIVANKIFGGIGGKLVTIGILISVYGTINGYTMTGMRASYALATEKSFPFWQTFKKLSASGVPVNSGILQVVIAVIMLFVTMFSSDAFNFLTNMLIFVIWIFYTMVFITVFILRNREPELDRPYKVPLYPIVPIIAIIGGVFILFMTLISSDYMSNQIPALVGVVFTLVGLPIYNHLDNKYHR
ncbi:APC family permease [Streptococcus phocae]|uniref:Amino acid permease n=1 Tax=Streptococcus phocae TaxID=119224 RepID=A0A0P6SKB1_9STRE|nr:amino acid permease [Streptococcus phocae]KPJ21938.1 amino acid permease [Streptococcus phocae]